MNAKIAKRGNIKTKWRAKDQNLVVLIARRDILLQIKNPSIAVNVDGVSLSKSRVRLPARIVQKAPFNFTRESSVRPMCCGFVVVVVVVVVVVIVLLLLLLFCCWVVPVSRLVSILVSFFCFNTSILNIAPDFCCFSFFNLQIVSLVFQVNFLIPKGQRYVLLVLWGGHRPAI